MTITLIPVAQLKPRADNLRFDANGDDLVASMKSLGVLQPLNVVPDPDDPGTYWIDAGHRRHDGAIKAGLVEVPCYLQEREVAASTDHTFTMLVENLKRENLTAIEEAHGYQALVDDGVKQAEIAKIMGVDAATVSRRLKLLKLPAEGQEAVHKGELSLELAELYTQLPAAIIELAVTERWDRWRVDGRLREIKVQKETAKLLKVATDAGLEVIDVNNVTDVVYDYVTVELEPTDDEGNGTGEKEEFDVFAYADEPMAVAKLAELDGVVGVALGWPDHPDYDSSRGRAFMPVAINTEDTEALSSAAPAGEGESVEEREARIKAEQKAEAKYKRDQKAHLREFIVALGQVPVKTGEVAPLIFTSVIERVPYEFRELFAEAAGWVPDGEKPTVAHFDDALKAGIPGKDLLRLASLATVCSQITFQKDTFHSGNSSAAELRKQFGWKELRRPAKPKAKTPKVEAESTDTQE